MRKHDFTTNQRLSDTDIVTAIKTNDETVLKSLYLENYSKIEFLILKNNGTKDHAKDIYQEAFLTLWKNTKEGKFIPQDQTSVNGYLYTVAKNKWMDYLRSNKYKKTKLVEDERQLEIHQDSFFLTLIDDKIENERLLDKAMDAFKNLGLPCKNLLMKFYFEKKSMREIAEELELDEASTRNKKYRCMEKLRELALKS